MTRAILLSFRYDAEPGGPNPVERIRIDERGGRTLLIVASCDWREDAGVDTSGNRILPAFKGGAPMTVSSSRSRARPRRASISSSIPRRTARASRSDLDRPIATQRGRDGTGAFATIDLGADDRIFRLTRTNPTTCHGLEETSKGHRGAAGRGHRFPPLKGEGPGRGHPPRSKGVDPLPTSPFQVEECVALRHRRLPSTIQNRALSLTGTGRGDHPKGGGWGPPMKRSRLRSVIVLMGPTPAVAPSTGFAGPPPPLCGGGSCPSRRRLTPSSRGSRRRSGRWC